MAGLVCQSLKLVGLPRVGYASRVYIEHRASLCGSAEGRKLVQRRTFE